MSLRGTIAALAVAACAHVGIANAQENVTITLKSGERLTTGRTENSPPMMWQSSTSLAGP
jgi:hypothetical protein